MLRALREAMSAGVKVTVVADRGFGHALMFQYLSEELGFESVIRLRGDIFVTSAKGERRKASEGAHSVWSNADPVVAMG